MSHLIKTYAVCKFSYFRLKELNGFNNEGQINKKKHERGDIDSLLCEMGTTRHKDPILIKNMRSVRKGLQVVLLSDTLRTSNMHILKQ